MNQAPIVEALRATGWKVQSTASVGGGFPDLVASRGHEVRLLEVKQPKGQLTVDQLRFIMQDGWPVTILRTVEEALAL